MTKWIYIAGSYIIIAVVMFLGLQHINSLTNTVKQQKIDIDGLKHSRQLLIASYNQEIEELTKSSKDRKVVIKEITKTIKGTKDEECANSPIGSHVLDKLRNHNKK